MCGHAESVRPTSLPSRSVLEHITDVHCHPTDTRILEEEAKALPIRICAMSTRGTDQDLVRDLAKMNPESVIPCFGYHPWFVHWISVKPLSSKEDHYKSLFLDGTPKPESIEAFDRLLSYLPGPTLLNDIISELRQNLLDFPNAMLGEVGVDRTARIPYMTPAPPPYAEHDGKRELSPFTIPLSHQLSIMEAQIDVAVEMKRNVSIHSVKSQQATAEFLTKMKAKHGKAWETISIDLHSCGFSAQSWLDIERRHANVYLSLSTAINARSPSHRDLIAACAPHRILAESDYPDIRYLLKQTWDMVRTIAEVKKWRIEDEWDYVDEDTNVEKWGVVRRLEENWKRFKSAKHVSLKKQRDRRKLTLDSDESDAEFM